jgi:hypothetical protein
MKNHYTGNFDIATYVDLIMESYLTSRFKRMVFLSGLPAASVAERIYCFVSKNEKRRINFVGGKYWVYYRAKDFLRDLPYISMSSLRRGIDFLISNGVILKRDGGIPSIRDGRHVCWFTFSDTAWEILRYRRSEMFGRKMQRSSTVCKRSKAQSVLCL